MTVPLLNRPRRRGVQLALMTVAGITTGCGSEPQPREEPAAGAAADVVENSFFVEPDISEAVANQARPVAAALMSTLSGRLQEAIAEGGAAGGLELCNVEALPLTARVAEEQGLEVTRTSLRLRNPANAPDPADAEALAWFQARVAAGGDPPTPQVRGVEGGGYRYYQPLMTAGLCVQCHGPRESLAADVLAALEERYPGDQAVGYAEGDWRGLLRVSVPESALTGS